MAPNSANGSEPTLRKRGSKKESQNSKLIEQDKPVKDDKAAPKYNIYMVFGCLFAALFYFNVPQEHFTRNLVQLKHRLAKLREVGPLTDSRPVAKDQLPLDPPEETYEYFQFMATVEQDFENVSLHEVPCRYEGYSREIARKAAPQTCGTLVFDQMIERDSMYRLREMAKTYCTLLGDTNYHNRESYNLRWINLHHLFKYGPEENLFNETDFELIRNTSEAVKHTVCSTFGLPPEKVYFSPVSQFTRYKPVVPFQEFRHVDKVRSPYLVVTTILWLSTVDIDFQGGRTEFLTGGPEPYTPLLLEPKFGRFAAWTSGWENPHGVMEVEDGERLALIFAFTVHDDIGHKNLEALREWAMVEVPDRTPEQIKRSRAPPQSHVPTGESSESGGSY